MSNFFGTDGIRGIAGKDLTARTAFALGNALCRNKSHVKVFVGRDNRVSSDMLFLALASGITAGGGTVIDGGVIPTAAVSFFVKRQRADYGVVISASHNVAKYNGLKVFNAQGHKLTPVQEEKLESYFDEYHYATALQCGNYRRFHHQHKMQYLEYLMHCFHGTLKGKKIVLDCANGVASKFAPPLFQKLGADVIALYTEKCGKNINADCGALYPQNIVKAVQKWKADAGFSYDGDADRLIACDENGQILDGDKILYILAMQYKASQRLTGNIVVGTAHTNTAIERAFAREGIMLLRADIGDKYVAEMMRKQNAILGGEQSGHILLGEYLPTGDGILASIKLAEKLQVEKLSQLAAITLMPQYNLNIKVQDKVRILGRERVQAAIENCNKKVERIVVRASGTEDVIRIFCEAEDMELAKAAAEDVKKIILMEDAQ